MADIKISELDPATAANLTDLLEASQAQAVGYLTKSITLDMVATVVADSDQIAEVIDGAIGAIDDYVLKAGDTMTGTLIAPALMPDADGSKPIGSLAARWGLVYGAPVLIGPAGTNRIIRFQTSTAGVGYGRWILGATTGAETGANVGSDFVLQALPDSGSGTLWNALAINRATGNATFSGTINKANLVETAGIASSIKFYDNGAGLINSMGTSASAYDFRSISTFNWYWGATPTKSASLTSNTLSIFGSGGVNSVILQHDNTHAYLRPQNAGSNLYFGAAGANYALVTSTGHLQPTTTGVSNFGAAAARWASVYGTIGDFSADLSVAVTPPTLASTSTIWSGGDITLSGANHAYMGNLYYEGGWKYTVGGATGAAIKVGIDTLIPFQLLVAPNNTGAAGAAAVPVPALQSNAVGALTAGVGLLAPTRAPLDNTTNVATTAFVTAALAAGASISVGTTPPVSPGANQLWWNSDASVGGGQMFIWYNDGSTTQWVPASPSVGSGGVAPGSIMDYAGDVAPAGWLLCQGQSLAVATYPALHAAILYKYGGSGANFNVPDLGGRVTAGKEAVATRLTAALSGINGSVLGAAGGGEAVALLDHQAASHVHYMAHGHPGDGGAAILYGNYGNAYGTTVAGGNYVGYATGVGTSSIVNTSASGSGTAHQNTQPTMIMNKIIKV